MHKELKYISELIDGANDSIYFYKQQLKLSETQTGKAFFNEKLKAYRTEISTLNSIQNHLKQ